MNDLMAMCVLGRPGSGKDTQAERLADTFNLHPIKTSVLLTKKFVTEINDPVVQEQKDLYDAGDLVDPPFVVSLIKEYIRSLFNRDMDSKNGIIFGGSPRTLYESEELIPFFVECFGKDRVFGIYIDVTEQECIERIIKRNARELDRDRDVLKVRMQEFEERTMPAIEYFQTHGTVLEVDGMGDIQTVFSSIQTALQPYHIQ